MIRREEKPVTQLDLLALVFIALKLHGSIDWSWWLVLAPILAPPIVLGLIDGAVGVYRKRRGLKIGGGT